MYPHCNWICEIRKFIREPGASLLIRGEPGTGKTILAFSLIKHLLDEGKIFYISTRVSPEKLFRMYPWLKEILDESAVLDASKEIAIVDARNPLREESHEVIYSMVFAMKYEDKPSFIRALISLTRNVENPILIIDSIEAVEKVVKASILEELMSISDDLNLKLIFVSEKREITENDYLVDGVIELKREIKNERVIRRMIIHKLRGVDIEQPCYLFTLKNGRFRLFEPFSYEMPEEPRLFEPLEDPDEDTFSSGSRSLDEIFGGFRKGSSILLEVDKGVTREMSYPFVTTFALNFLRKGRKVYGIRTLGTEKDRLERELSLFVKPEEFQRFIWIEKDWGKERLSEEKAKEEAEKIYEIIVKLMGKTPEGLTVVGIDALHSRYGNAMVTVVEEGIQYIKETKGLAIFIAKSGAPYLEDLSNLTDVHIKIKNICGVPVIKGLIPKTQYYMMMIDISQGFPKVEFVKIE